ncbi:MAG: recombinase family protein [Thermoflexales bacterium]|nr:recombinase family protein [Thermoflexales bacterium]
MPTQALRAAGYTRVSMREQVDGHSLDAQIAHIKAYVTAQGWHLAQVYTDAGISAKKGSQRPAYEQMLADARANSFDIVVVDKIDRFSRHLSSLLSALDQLNEANVSFVSVQEHLDLTTPWGKLMLTVLGMLAEIYIDNLRQETRKGKLQRARKGLWNGAIPFGYCSGLCAKCADPNGAGYCPNFGQPDQTDGKHLFVHPIESLAVKLAFEWCTTEQLSDGRIADKLNAYLHTLPDGSTLHFRTKGHPGRFQPGPFTKDAVRDLLQRKLYIGQVVYRGTDEQGKRRRRSHVAETFDSDHPTLIDRATFDQAQALRQAWTHSPRFQYNKPAEVYPLSGLIRCASCGLPMRAFSSGGRRYYQDVTRIEHRGTCDQVVVHAEDIEAQVIDYFSHIQWPDDWPAGAAQVLGLQEIQDGQQATERWERAKELYIRGDINRDMYEEEARIFASQDWDLTKTQFNASITAGYVLRELVASWCSSLPLEKKRLLRLSLSAVYVRGYALVAIQPTPALFPLVSNFTKDLYCRYGDDGCYPFPF